MTYSDWREELFEAKAQVFKTIFGAAKKVFTGRPASTKSKVEFGKNFKSVFGYKNQTSTMQYPSGVTSSPRQTFVREVRIDMTAIPDKVRDSYYTTGRPSFMGQRYNVLDPNQFRAIDAKGKILKPSEKLLKKDIAKIISSKNQLQGNNEVKSLIDLRKSQFKKQKELYDKQVKKSNKDTYINPSDGKEYDIPEEVMAAPTNSVGGGQIAGTVEAGDDPPKKKKKKKTYAYGGRGSRKMWMSK